MHRPMPRRAATSGTVYVSTRGRSFREIGSSRSKRAASRGMTFVVTSDFLSEPVRLALSGIAGSLSSFARSGGCRQGKRGVSGGEVANSGEFPVGDNEGGVLLV